MQSITVCLSLTLACFLCASAGVAGEDSGFRYLVDAGANDAPHAFDLVTVYSIQFGVGGNGAAGEYSVDILMWNGGTCSAAPSNSVLGIGSGHPTTPAAGHTYSLSGTGLYNYLVAKPILLSDIGAFNSFRLRDGNNPGVEGSCIVLTCDTTDCSFSTGSPGTLTLNLLPPP
jgi:hypothetical protein